MLLFGLALLAGGIGVLVRLRGELRDQFPLPALRLPPVLRPRGPGRTAAHGQSTSRAARPIARGRPRAAPDRLRPEGSAPRTEVLRDPVTRLPARPRAIGRAAPLPPSLPSIRRDPPRRPG